MQFNRDDINPLAVITNDNTVQLLDNDTVINLKSLKITVLYLRSLSFLRLTHLYISDNYIKWLPSIQTLETLDCSNCELSSLPTDLPNLKTLRCASNILTVIPNYSKLTTLIADNNPLTSVNLPNLTHLSVLNCPILVVHDILSIRKNHIKPFLNTSKVLIDWTTNKCNKKLFEIITEEFGLLARFLLTANK
jgi:Leucine-rich repeat (LRR) protein